MSNGIWEMNLLSLFQAMGSLRYPLALCSVFSVAIIIDKIIYFAKIRTNLPLLREQVFEFVKNNKIKEALGLCDTNPSPVAKIFRAGLIKFGSTREDIKEQMENISLIEIPKLEIRLNALATIANISPLLGLLGTVTGMLSCFHTIQMRAASFNPVTPGDLAGGIGEALLTTVAGLIIAIPTYMAYNYFIEHVNRVVLEMERGATELLNFMSQVTETSFEKL